MREILFRGKRVDNGEWITGYYAKQSNHTCFANELKYTHFIYKDVFMDWNLGGLCETEVDPETVGQYTGLNDKNGNPIFEGDVVTMPKYGGGKTKSVVYFKDGKFAVDGSNYAFKDICPQRMEVVGNFYDNPELFVKE